MWVIEFYDTGKTLYLLDDDRTSNSPKFYPSREAAFRKLETMAPYMKARCKVVQFADVLAQQPKPDIKRLDQLPAA